MGENLNKFIEDTILINSCGSNFTLEDAYIAGVLRFKTDLDIKSILGHILKVKETFNKENIRGANQINAYFKLYQGDFESLNDGNQLHTSVDDILASPDIFYMPSSPTLLLTSDQSNTSEIFDYNPQTLVENLCEICHDSTSFTDSVQSLTCSHSYHTSCYKTHINSCINSYKFPIYCPNLACKIEICWENLNGFIDQPHLQGLIDYYEYKNNCLYRCPTAKCTYVFSPSITQVKFECPVCELDYCLSCKTRYHQNFDCKMTVQSKFKQCYKCSEYTTPNNPCICGASTCYSCGYSVNSCDCKASLKIYFT